MKITIIGGGNMGGSIAKGLTLGSIFKADDICVVDTNNAVLESITKFNKKINTSNNGTEAVKNADIILIAVKPWLVNAVINSIKDSLNYEKQLIVSIAAGVSFEDLKKALAKTEGYAAPVIFRLMPNIAISIRQSMTFVASNNAKEEQTKLILDIFNELGEAIPIDESLMSAATALSSSGLGFAFRYMRASVEAGVELGFFAKQATAIVAQTVKGAAMLLQAQDTHPEIEVDKVTTPGGTTIAGLNEMEANGFSNAVIKGIKAAKK
ncbi:MAG: pyrroline-5-carboxylate reductase [Paludibacteraceae bacterium]|nr:pyrroline-5-carboxylate reductase [Paludibacteraceae bacterium]